MKVNRISKNDLLKIDNSITSMVKMTTIPLEAIEILAVTVGNSKYDATQLDMARAKGDFETAQSMYNIDQIILLNYKVKDHTFQTDPSLLGTKSIAFKSEVLDNAQIAHKIRKMSSWELEDHLLIVQIGPDDDPISESETNDYSDNLIVTLPDNVIEALQGICTHRCLDVYGFAK
jgi:hypothetical protein